MKAKDIVVQLLDQLPKHDDRFNDQIGIVSLVAVGNTVTATTSTAHGLADGAATTITGALVETPISSLTFLDGVVSAVTSSDHDLTLNLSTATVKDATESDYNGTFELLTVKNRREFQYEISGTPTSPATGSPILLEDRIDGYNGMFIITLVSSTVFTYEVDIAPSGDADVTDAFVNTQARISRVINIEHAIEAYTKHLDNQYWLFVSLEDVTVSRDRSLKSDHTVNAVKNQKIRLDTVRRVNIDVFFPSSNEYTAGKARDDAEDVAVSLVSALMNFQPPSGYIDETQFILALNSHVAHAFVKPYYVHRYIFETREDILNEDGFQEVTRAFRDINLDTNNSFEEVIASATIDLDEEPL